VHGHRGRRWTGDVHSGVDVERTLTGQLPVQPNLGGAPVAPDRDRRDLEHLRRLVDGEAAEKAQFDDLGFSSVDARELVQSIIEGDEVDGRVVAHDGGFVQRDVLHTAPTFEIVPSRALHEDATHQLRRDGEEVRPILPPHPLVIDETNVGLVDERGRLQTVGGTLAFHVEACQAAELRVHDGRQGFERSLIAVAPSAKQSADRTVHRSPGS